MKQRVLLQLGASHAQIPLIRAAHRRGYRVVTCDYLPDNPGHGLADESYNVSTTDAEAVLALAKRIKSDVISAYASDPAAPVAAFVAEKLGLPGNSFNSVCRLAYKDQFRSLMRQLGLKTPSSTIVGPNDDIAVLTRSLTYPLVVKPIDASGSKGISCVSRPEGLRKAVGHALAYSRALRIIVEEYVGAAGGDWHGDGFVQNGELVFMALGDHLYDGEINPLNPVGTIWPALMSDTQRSKIETSIADIISASGFMNGPVNLEVRITESKEPVIMEVGPRNGGHYVPQAIQAATGFDFVEAMLDSFEGRHVASKSATMNPSAYYAVHANCEGVLKAIQFPPEVEQVLQEYIPYIKPGAVVEPFVNSKAVIGIAILKAADRAQIETALTHFGRCVSIRPLRLAASHE